MPIITAATTRVATDQVIRHMCRPGAPAAAVVPVTASSSAGLLVCKTPEDTADDHPSPWPVATAWGWAAEHHAGTSYTPPMAAPGSL